MKLNKKNKKVVISERYNDVIRGKINHAKYNSEVDSYENTVIQLGARDINSPEQDRNWEQNDDPASEYPINRNDIPF